MGSKLRTLDDLYVDLLKDLYSAEKQLTKALPQMAKNAQSPDLKKAFEDHLRQTEMQAQRIEKIFSAMSGSPQGKTCAGMEGLLREGKEVMNEAAEKEAGDAGMIAAAQKVEHYEIAGYGTARAWARHLGYNEAADLLDQTLAEESKANELLTRIAESHVNREAQQH